MSPMAGNSCTRNYAEVRMRGSGLINGDTMSSESKDELNGEIGEKTTLENITEKGNKTVIASAIISEKSAENSEGGTFDTHTENGKNDLVNSNAENKEHGDTGINSEDLTKSDEKLTNGALNEPNTENAELTYSQTKEENDLDNNERPDTSETDKDYEKLKDTQEHIDVNSANSSMKEKDQSLSAEVKKNIVENVLSRYIQHVQDAKKQNIEVSNGTSIAKTFQGSTGLSQGDNIEECKAAPTDVSDSILSNAQSEVIGSENDSATCVQKGSPDKSNNYESTTEQNSQPPDISEKQIETAPHLESVEQSSECKVTEELKVYDTDLKPPKTDMQNDDECPLLEPEVPMETDSPDLNVELDSSISKDDHLGNNADQMDYQANDSFSNADIITKNIGHEELVSKMQVEEEKNDKTESEATIIKISPTENSDNEKVNSLDHNKIPENTDNQNEKEKVIIYHEDTVRFIEKSEVVGQSCDKKNNANDVKEAEPNSGEILKVDVNLMATSSSCVTSPSIPALVSNKVTLAGKKSPEPFNKPRSQKLDELLSKIATKASSNLDIPKKAKARKSFSNTGPAIEKAVISNMPVSTASITSLTFNVKMLEKQGVLDIPKTQNKRKAFEPFKLKVKQTDKVDKSPVKVSPIRSPVKSPKDSPFFNTSKVIKGRRRKKKKMGSYMLPSEKKARERVIKSKERKKASEERQLTDDEKIDVRSKLSEKVNRQSKMSEKNNSNSKMDCSDHNTQTESLSESELWQHRKSPLLPKSAKSVGDELKTPPKQQNALDMLTKNSKLSFSVSPNQNLKKARKTVRPGVDKNSQIRTLDSFLTGGSYPQISSAIQQNQVPVKSTSPGTNLDHAYHSTRQTSGVRKRKATEVTHITAARSSVGNSSENQEEKKRKTELSLGQSPPPFLRIVGSPPLASGVVPIMPSPISISTTSPMAITQITSPTSKQQQKTIIQNGTINGLPVFQIIPNGNFSPSQLVAIGTQGQSLLPKTALLQPASSPGMPVILTPVPMPTVVSSATVTSMQNQVSLLSPHSAGTINLQNKAIMPVNSSGPGMPLHASVEPIASPIPLSVFNQSIVSSHGQMPVLNHILKTPLNSSSQTLKSSHIPNGLYPVTPPRTPDEQAGSDTGSQDSVGVSPGQQVSPDKDIIPLCTCKLNGVSFPKLVAAVTYCQALDSIDGKAMGCCNRVSNSQLVRPAVKIPFMAVCENHRKRLKLHQCCPGCGHFCTQGRFLQCRNEGNQIVHNFHEQCQVIKDDKNFCPHCGETSAQVEVTLMLQEKKPQTLETKSSRLQSKAKMAIAEKKSAGSGDESSDEIAVVLEKTKKVLSTSEIPVGPDKHSLERVLSSLAQERPKKYRHLPKCLFTPAYDNDLERVVYMLEDGHDPNEKYEDLEGQGAIHAAAAIGNLPIVHILLQAGASPHLQDKSLRTPLMFAAENNHPQVVKYLLKVGAVINSKADDGMTALHYAAKAGHVGIIKVLLDTDGLDIDVKDDGGYTPLIWASEHEQLDVVKFLLKRNADPNLRDSEENTALHWAAFSGSANVSEILLGAGCELDSLNMHGDRPLHIASRQDHYECVVLFLARGADVELENNKGETPEKCCIEVNSATCLALRVNKQLKGFGAKHMGRPEKLIHRDISKGRENIPIPCVNGIDDDGIPRDYLYVTDNIETKCLNVNRVIGSLQCCQCKDDCSSIYCACGKSSVKCWYDKFGRLVPEFNMLEPSLIFECNRACECWTTCNNRVVQNGVMSRLQVFKTEGRGWGCRTLVNIARGTFICEYIGEHISDSEADRREDDSYLFDLDNKDGETYCIDARKYGNVARFINHLCEPNLVPVKVFVDSQDLRFPRICLFASRDINAQEELGFDYGEKFWIIKWKQFTCTCGSVKCRYSKDTIQKTLEEYRARHEDEADITQD